MSALIVNKKLGLTNNQLKIIAAISMLLDHIGLIIYPSNVIFRILGRIAFPIYAFLIAEGCKHTKNKKKYLGLIAAMGIAFQIFYFIFMNDLYQGILITFSLSISLIFSIESFIKNKAISNRILMSIVVLGILFITLVCPKLFWEYGFALDYRIWGVTLPALMYFVKGKYAKVIFCAIFLGIMAFFSYRIQWYALLSVPLIAIYNGERGKAKMKYFFYIFYPLHLVIIYGIAILIQILR